jgi:hypothetical protein
VYGAGPAISRLSAVLFDLPLAPAKISNIMRFLHFADAAYPDDAGGYRPL